MAGFVGNIEELTLRNSFFRQVIFTGAHSQLVLMCLQPGEEIGEEVHDVDQFFRFEQGDEGKVIIDGVESAVKDGMAVVIPAGAKHNVVNASATQQLKLYTIYSPAQHTDGTVHETKAQAIADETDHL